MRIDLILIAVAWFVGMFLLDGLARNRETQRLRELVKDTRALARSFQDTASQMRLPSGAVALRIEFRPLTVAHRRLGPSPSSASEQMVQTVGRVVARKMRDYDRGTATILWDAARAELKVESPGAHSYGALVNQHLHTELPRLDDSELLASHG